MRPELVAYEVGMDGDELGTDEDEVGADRDDLGTGRENSGTPRNWFGTLAGGSWHPFAGGTSAPSPRSKRRSTGQAEPAKPYGPRRLRIPRKIGPGVRADGSGRRLGVQSSRIPLGATAPRAVAPSGPPSLR